ncbi:hypothetical protein B0T26DRAFT_205586 [Lasiosphaeria miniovina]|uniref:Uncharacterized protein n=1 Tax=Lasiosphaeria miniovina TaxID=1954250 RepID=A0AA40E4F4_9PEZI|nr:uncharacterized protein B0T26DRAFT_205586 [Lasiosphaeria miniovina]KAK0722163.1 hypothetical protein B0T26DRAFT_205586 [Lasiosphaeria miniovina]
MASSPGSAGPSSSSGWFRSLLNAASSLAAAQLSTDDACAELSRHVPEPLTLAALRAEALTADRRLICFQDENNKNTKKNSKQTASTTRPLLLAILAYLRSGNITAGTSQDATAAAAGGELALAVAQAIAPVAADDDKDARIKGLGLDNHDRARLYADAAAHCTAVGLAGLAILQALSDLLSDSSSSSRFDDQVLLTLVAYASADDDDSWSTAETAARAGAVLRDQLGSSSSSREREQFAAEAVLQRYLRPLFSKSKPASVTASGRKVEYAAAGGSAVASSLGPEGEPRDTKPWKYVDFRAIPAVCWVINEADEQFISKQWPLYIPVLMTLVDDSATSVRSRGLVALAAFLRKLPDQTLHDTGLSAVFEEAVFPTLAFLPSLTPEDESLQLLGPAFSALLCLAGKQVREQQQQRQRPTAKDATGGGGKNKMLDRILRQGVFAAHLHAQDHVRIVEVLCQQTALIIGEMGIHAVKHLKDLIPLLSGIMTDPFAPVSPATLLSAIQALEAVLANCWPKIPVSPWEDEIITALAVCWLNWNDDDTPGAAVTARGGQVEQELIKLAQALGAVLESGSKTETNSPADLYERVAPLVAKEPSLDRLFTRVR